MKRFLITSAAAFALAAPAYAGDSTKSYTSGDTAMIKAHPFDQASELHASDLMAMPVYSIEGTLDGAQASVSEIPENWTQIGDVNDIILTKDGDVQALIVGVGGFLGMGEKDVSMTMDQVKFVADSDEEGTMYLVSAATKDSLTDAEAYTWSMEDVRDVRADTDMAMDNAMDRPMLNRPMVEREGWMTTSLDELTAEDIDGMTVYGTNDENVGEISELIISTDGKIEMAVIDVGGFLGLGEKPVAVTFDELQLLRSDAGDDLRIYIDSTEEALEQQPEYQG